MSKNENSLMRGKGEPKENKAANKELDIARDDEGYLGKWRTASNSTKYFIRDGETPRQAFKRMHKVDLADKDYKKVNDEDTGIDDVLQLSPDLIKAFEEQERKKQQSKNEQLTAKDKVAIMKEKGAAFGGRTHEEYLPALLEAKKTVEAERAWRVSDYNGDVEEFKASHPNAKLHITDGGSTIAVDTDGDIIAVCKNKKDKTISGSQMLQLAVVNGGTKLDSYAGNHKFYCKNGFEPVSWCEFNEEYAPHDWKKNTDGYEKEPIIFYRYTGENSNEKWEEFCVRVPVSEDYDTAQKIRDSKIKENKENGNK